LEDAAVALEPGYLGQEHVVIDSEPQELIQGRQGVESAEQSAKITGGPKCGSHAHAVDGHDVVTGEHPLAADHARTPCPGPRLLEDREWRNPARH
jgi:hypothetical protein